MRRCVPTRRGTGLFFLLAASAAAAGCRSDAFGGTDDPLSRVPVWTLERDLSIGHEDDPLHQLSNLGPVLGGPGGTVLVGQPQESRFRVFDAEGAFVRFIGRAGEGPGEIGTLVSAGVRGDTLWVVDNRRRQYFDLEGRPLGTDALIPTSAGSPFIWAANSRSLLVNGWELRQPSYLLRDRVSGAVHSQPVMLLAPGEDAPRPVERPGIVDWIEFTGADGSAVYVAAPDTYASPAAVAPDGRTFVVVEQTRGTRDERATFHMVRYAADGERIGSGTIEYLPVSVTPGRADTLLEAAAARVEPRFASLDAARRAVRANVPVPDVFVPIDRVVVDRDGRVWLRRTGGPRLGWLLLDADLRPLARVVLEGGFSVTEATTGDHVWSTEHDAYDVPRLVRHRLVRGAPR